MSNRIYNQQLALDKQMVTIFGSFVVGSAGAVGTVKGLGVLSVVKGSPAGNYTITLEDKYSRYMFGGWGIIKNTSASGVFACEVLEDPATLQASFQSVPSITIQFYDATGTAASPAAGSVVGFTIVARRSSVGIS
jgi:hypothetical protein